MQAMTEREELIVIEQVVKEAGLTCLGDVLRSGQWYASLYLSTPAQIKDLEKPVAPANVKGECSNWRLISFQLTHPTQVGLEQFLVGERGPKRTVTVTSPVTAIDLENGLVRTRNSVYRIRMDERGVGEPPANQLIAICRTMRSWGLGAAFGIPRI